MKRLFTSLLMLLLLTSISFTIDLPVNASQSKSTIVALDNDTIQYTSISNECKQIPCESQGGIYFLNQNQLSFYSIAEHTTTLLYTFDTKNLFFQDSFVANEKLYVLESDDYLENTAITIYNLTEQKYERTLTFTQYAECIGVDATGRIYLAANRTINLLSSEGNLLSQTTFNQDIYRFDAFDSKTDNFYFEGYYNWIYWGYDHDMNALYVGNVSSNNEITSNSTPLTLISQQYYYARQDAVELIGEQYLCIDSTFSGDLSIWDSNGITVNELADDCIFSLERDNWESGSFDKKACVGTRTIYRKSSNTIVTFKDNQTLTEYNLKTGTEFVSSKTTYPVFSLMEYGTNIVAVEKNGNQFYLEIFPWQQATSVTITGKTSTMKVGDTLQLTATTDGTLEETFTWSSSNSKVASVNNLGEVFAWSKGSTNITVKTSTGLSKTYTINVTTASSLKNPTSNVTITQGTKSTNLSNNNYSVWSSVVNSYLTQTKDNSLVRVENIGKKVIIETYSSDGKTLKSTKKLDLELSLFGGFFSGKDYNYLVFGQENSSESDKTEVIRVVKFSKKWERISAASINGANTYIPFDAGSLRMCEVNGKLYLYTCHEMYQTDDGYHHQSNMTFVIDEDKMTVDQSYYDIMNIAQAGYVSHSFNQFIQTDGEYVYRVDHGDAGPRAISITKCKVDGDITNVSYTLPINLSNVSGYNSTGASIGGFELSSDSCLIVGNAVDFTKSTANYYDVRNIFVTITDKNLAQSKIVWLTKYTEQSKITVNTPQLVKLGTDQYLMIWEETKNDSTYTRMVTIDGNGNKTSDVVKTTLSLSDCQPILCTDGFVRWYTTDNGTPNIYSINPFDLKSTHAKHDYEDKVVKPTYTTKGYTLHTCTYCGDSYKDTYTAKKTLGTTKLQDFSSTTTSVTIRWKTVSDATGYLIYRQDLSTKEWKQVGKVTGAKTTQYKQSKLKAGQTYNYQVKAYLTQNGQTYYGKASASIKTSTNPFTVTIKKTTSAKTSIHLYWKKVTCSGYILQQYNAKTKKWTNIKTLSASKTDYEITKLTKNTTYKFRIQAYTKAGTTKVNSAWSKVVSVRTKK